MDELVGKWNKNCYTIMEKIGQGNYGKLYKCRDQKGNIQALKLSLSFSSITREYNILKRLNHLKCIPNVYDYDDCIYQDNLYHFIVMDFIEGINLKEYLLMYKFPLNEVYSIGLKIYIFLEKLYELGYKYTDIKLENILINKNLDIFVVDFGGVIEMDISTIEYTPCYNLLSWRDPCSKEYQEHMIFNTTMVLLSLIFNKEYSPLMFELEDIIVKIKNSTLNKDIKNVLISGLMGTYISSNKYKEDLIKLSCTSHRFDTGFDKIDCFFVGSIVFFICAILIGVKVCFF